MVALLLTACSDPPSATSAPVEVNADGVRVRAGRREVVVHCALSCDAASAELDRLSTDCTHDVSSQPHLLSTNDAILALACCQEAAMSYEHGCGHEALGGCIAGWSSRCQGTTVPLPSIDDEDRGVSTERGAAR